MPEHVPGPPPSEQSQSNPNFHIDPEEAQDLGFTVTEAMRYGRTGELPERVERLNVTTFRDQALTSRGPFRLSPEERTALAAYWDRQAGRTPQLEEVPAPEAADELEPAPPMPDFAAFKPWALSELQTVGTEIDEILAGKPEAALSATVLKRVDRWNSAHESTKARFSGDAEVPDAVVATLSYVDKVLERPDLPPDTRVDLIDAATRLQDFLGHRRVSSKLAEDVVANGPALLSGILERPDQVGDCALEAIPFVLRGVPDPEVRKQLAFHALMPLARRLEYTRQHDETHFFIINKFLDLIDESEASMQEALSQGVRLGEVGDAMVVGLNAKFNAGAMVPHHYELLELLTGLDRLYSPQHAEPQPVTPAMTAFVEKVYRDRVPGYEDHRLMKQLAGPFNRLATACDSDRRIR